MNSNVQKCPCVYNKGSCSEHKVQCVCVCALTNSCQSGQTLTRWPTKLRHMKRVEQAAGPGLWEPFVMWPEARFTKQDLGVIEVTSGLTLGFSVSRWRFTSDQDRSPWLLMLNTWPAPEQGMLEITSRLVLKRRRLTNQSSVRRS